MKVLDLFAGLEGWSAPFRERGHEVFSVDNDPQFRVDLVKDVMLMTRHDLPWRPDIILASPPCEAFSVLRIGKNWTPPPENAPKTEHARFAVRLVERTREIVGVLDPAFFIIENPRGKLRKLPVVSDLERRTVTYCQYGEKWMKPTDLWGGFPPSLSLYPRCKNGDPCHVPAPRGSTTGVQGKGTAAERAKIPHLLALEVCMAAEEDLARRQRWDS